MRVNGIGWVVVGIWIGAVIYTTSWGDTYRLQISPGEPPTITEAKESICEVTKEQLISYIIDRSEVVHHRLANDIAGLLLEIPPKHGLPSSLIIALVEVESEFDPRAKSPKGALGLAQIMPTVWLAELKEKGLISEERDLYDPRLSIEAGCLVLNKYLGETKTMRKALDKYVGKVHNDVKYFERVMTALGRFLYHRINEGYDMDTQELEGETNEIRDDSGQVE